MLQPERVRIDLSDLKTVISISIKNAPNVLQLWKRTNRGKIEKKSKNTLINLYCIFYRFFNIVLIIIKKLQEIGQNFCDLI